MWLRQAMSALRVDLMLRALSLFSFLYNGHEFEQSLSCLIHHADKQVDAPSHVCSPCLIDFGGIGKLSSITPPTHNQNA